MTSTSPSPRAFNARLSSGRSRFLPETFSSKTCLQPAFFIRRVGPQAIGSWWTPEHTQKWSFYPLHSASNIRTEHVSTWVIVLRFTQAPRDPARDTLSFVSFEITAW